VLAISHYCVHGGFEIEVDNIGGQELGIWCGDHPVEEAFGCGDVCGGSANFARIVNAVATNSEADLFVFLLFRSNFGNDADIGGFAVGGHGSVGNRATAAATAALKLASEARLGVERFCEMELREPHSKPTHKPFGRTNTKRKKWTNKKVKRNQTRDIVFKRTAASKQ
jgi:hypothetical protein